MSTLGVLFLLLLCRLADCGNFVTTIPDSFNAAAQLGESSFALMHVQGNCSPFRIPNSTWFNAIIESIKGDTHRYRAITQGRGRVVGKSKNNLPRENADVPLASGQASNTANYIIKLGFGTPGQSFYTVVDTGSDITWIPCTPCSDCSGQVFEPSKSPTFQYLGCASEACQSILGNTSGCGISNCSFTETYGDGSQSNQVLSSDTLAVGSQSVENDLDLIELSLSRILRDNPHVYVGDDTKSKLIQDDKDRQLLFRLLDQLSSLRAERDQKTLPPITENIGDSGSVGSNVTINKMEDNLPTTDGPIEDDKFIEKELI